MAVTLELVVNFGTNETAAAAATAAVGDQGSLSVRGTSLALEQPYLSTFGAPMAYLEFTVGVGIHSNFTLPDERGQHRPLSHAELTSVGQQLYALLRKFTDYQAAIVGWNAEWVVEFAGDYFPHPRSGPDELASIEGLVLATDLYDRWGAWETWQPFTDGYRWLPYEGDRTS